MPIHSPRFAQVLEKKHGQTWKFIMDDLQYTSLLAHNPACYGFKCVKWRLTNKHMLYSSINLQKMASLWSVCEVSVTAPSGYDITSDVALTSQIILLGCYVYG